MRLSLITIMAGVISYPFDTIRREQMMTGDNLVVACQHIYQSGGALGFFEGVIENVARGVIASLVFVAYDYVALTIRNL